MAILGNTKATNLTLLDGFVGNLNPVETGVYDLGTSSLKWRTLYGNAESASAVKDNGNGTLTKFQYSASGMSSTSWLGSWDEYTLKAITPANAVKSGIGTTAIGSATKPVYWTGSAFAAISSYEGTAATADKLTGFSSRAANFTWGNLTGTAITAMNDSSGGSLGFRKDNPASGQMSMVIDGTVYIKEGAINVGDAIKSITRNGTTFTYTTLWGNTGTFDLLDSNTTSFTITANATDGIWDVTGTNGTNAVTYAVGPYSSLLTKASFDTSTTNPNRSDRLNYNGYLYATKLYSGGNEVLTLSGGTMTGAIKRYYSAASTDPVIAITANNQDATALWMGHGTAAGNPSGNYYKFLYKGTGSSPNNYFLLIAGVNSSSEVIAMLVNEQGNVSFTNTVAADISGNAATATAVTQKNQIDPNDYRILLSGSANDTDETKGTNKSTNLRFNPSTKVFSVGGDINATGDLTITGNTNLNSETYAESITAGSLLVNGAANFVNIPTAPTPEVTSNDTSIATTAFVKNNIGGLSGAMHFKGTTKTAMSDGLTTATVTIGDSSYTPEAGDVVLYGDSEFVWTDSIWERLGRDSSFKTTQTAVTKPTATTNKWVSAIGQDANGNISVDYSTLVTTGTWSGNAATASKLGTSSVGSSIQPIYLSNGTATKGEYMLPIYYSNLDYTSTTPVPGAYTVNAQTHPVTGVAEYGSALSLPGIDSSTKHYAAQLLISSPSGQASAVHGYIRRLTSAPSWSNWSTLLDDKNFDNYTIKKSDIDGTVGLVAYYTDTNTIGGDADFLWDATDNKLTAAKLNGYVMAGQKTGTTLGSKATAEGNDTTASGANAHAEGDTTTASSVSSHAEGYLTIASGNSASQGNHAEGYKTTASGLTGAHAEGCLTTASGSFGAHAEGDLTTANGTYGPHAEGYKTTASGMGSHAEGQTTTASGTYSHAEGGYNTASGTYAHTEGYATTALRRSLHVFGEANILDTEGASGSKKGTYIEIVGNGTASDSGGVLTVTTRSNARTLDWSGNESLAGNLLPMVTNTKTLGDSNHTWADAYITTTHGDLDGNAATATKFASAQSITLTGDVTGSASSQAGWSIATTLANSGVTAKTYGNTSQLTPSHGGTFNIPYFKVDAKGRVTLAGTTTVKLPADSNTDTKVNVKARGTTKAYIMGDTTAPTSSAAAHEAVAETTIYMDTTAGAVAATSYKIAEKVILLYNTTTNALDFVFA